MNWTRVQLLTSHALSTWGNSLWSFAIGLFLVILFPESLQLSAIYGLILAASILVMGSSIGFWIDHTSRLKAARIALFVQNGAVAACAFALCLLLNYRDSWETNQEHWLVILAQVAVVLLADVASLASEAQRIILERDWIVIIAGDDNADLAKMNSIFRTIDLTTFVVAPSLVGMIMSALSPMVAAIFLGSWNVVSLFVEYFLLVSIFNRVPELALPRSDQNLLKTVLSQPELASLVPGKDEGNFEDKKKLLSSSSTEKQRHWFVEAVRAWKLYCLHPVFPAGFGLACLYMTVLGFDNVTSGYLYSQKVPEWLVGVCTGVGSIFGVLGAVIYPALRRRFGLPATAVIGFATFNVLTSGAIVASFLPGSPFELLSNSTIIIPPNPGPNGPTIPLPEYLNPSNLTFIICLIIGRTGLWIADLSITQSMQESVEPNLRGEINGVQSSMNYLMEVIKFGLVTALPTTPVFGYLIIASEFFTVFGWACGLYYLLTYKNRGIRRASRLHSEAKVLLYDDLSQKKIPSNKSLGQTWITNGSPEPTSNGKSYPLVYGTFGSS